MDINDLNECIRYDRMGVDNLSNLITLGRSPIQSQV